MAILLIALLLALPFHLARAQDALPKRTRLSGHVVDPAGRPIDGALVDLGGSRPPQGPGTEPWILTTDSLGRFYFDSAVVNGFIRVRSFGYKPYVKRLNLTAPTASVRIRMIVDTSVANTCTRLCDLVYHRRTARGISEMQRRKQPLLIPDSAGVVAVYRAVLDSILSVRGEAPKLIVLSDSTFGGFSFCTRRPCEKLPPHRSVIDSSTVRAFDDYTHRRHNSRESATPLLPYRIPIILESETDRDEMMRLGVALGQNQYAPGMYDVEGFWRSYRQIYPGAWGTTWMSPPAFSESRDEALMHVMHVCGPNCRSAEIIYLRRQGDGWRVKERIPAQIPEEGWNVAPLRYIGEGGTHAQQEIDIANARRAASADSIRLWNAPRRIHGRITYWTSGLPIENAIVAVHQRTADSIRIVRANRRGEFVIKNPPIGPAMLEVRCAAPRGARHAGLIGFVGNSGPPAVYVLPSIDTAFDIRVQDLSPCWREFHYHKLDVAGELIAADSLPAAVPSDVAAVYAAALTALKRFHRESVLTVSANASVSCARTHECDMDELDSLVAAEAVFSETAEAFVFANQHGEPLPKLAARHQLITPGERTFLLDQAQFRMTYRDADVDTLFWRAFRETHPGSRGIVTLSAIGFNQRRTEALLETNYEASGTFPRRRYLVLKKKSGSWRVTDSR